MMDSFDRDESMKAIGEIMGDRCGFFKLESSFPMEQATVLNVYRSRVAVEHLISLIKSV